MWSFGGVKVVVLPDMRDEYPIKAAELIPLSANKSYIHYFGHGSKHLTFTIMVAGNTKKKQIDNLTKSGLSILLYGPIGNPIYSGNIFVTSIRWTAQNVICQTWDNEVPRDITVVYKGVVEAIEDD